MPPKINYTGVFLDDSSKKTLHDKFGNQVPSDWTWSGDHMTIEFGKNAELPKEIGTVVTLTVTHLGKSNDAWALKVAGYESKKATPHITLAYRVNPKNSNDITDWKDTEQFTLTGNVGILYHGARRKKTRRAVNKLKNRLRKRMSRRA